MNAFVSKYTIHITNNHMTVNNKCFPNFWKFSALLGFINILNHCIISKINITNDIADSAQEIMLYTMGIFLSASIHDHICHRSVAALLKTSFCFQ